MKNVLRYVLLMIFCLNLASCSSNVNETLKSNEAALAEKEVVEDTSDIEASDDAEGLLTVISAPDDDIFMEAKIEYSPDTSIILDFYVTYTEDHGFDTVYVRSNMKDEAVELFNVSGTPYFADEINISMSDYRNLLVNIGGLSYNYDVSEFIDSNVGSEVFDTIESFSDKDSK